MDTDEDEFLVFHQSDDDDSDNNVEVAKVAVAKSGEDAYTDQRIKEMSINPDGQQHRFVLSSGISYPNMLNPNQDTSVDDIF
ncbi:hypothetical protein Tco_0904442 [Tanacetum coccineum]